MVFAKSYNAQLARSIVGARVAVDDADSDGDGDGRCMNPWILIDDT